MPGKLPPSDTAGLFTSGTYAGKGVIVWRDQARGVAPGERGWHIEIFDPPLGSSAGETFDIWADDDEQLVEWFSQPDFRDVEWPS